MSCVHARDSCFSVDGSISDEVFLSIQKARLAFSSLKHLCRPVIDRRSSLHRSEIGTAIRHRSVTAEDERCAKTFGV